MLALALFAFTMTSCGDDDNGCTVCKLTVPLLSDCEIEVCEDGTSSRKSGGDVCLGGEAAITAASAATQQEKIDALTAAGFSCN